MSEDGYGQQASMEHASMVGTLETQAEMVWPVEWPLLRRLGLPEAKDVADLGCGTGEFAGRLARACPSLAIHGIDLFPRHIELAKAAWPTARHPRLAFDVGDARATGLPDASMGAVVMRHFLHAIPDADRVLGEARRLLRPGGLVYTLAEDYQTLLFDAPPEAASLFQQAQPHMLGVGTDLHHGRKAFRLLRTAGFDDVRVEALVVDTQTADRETFARMMAHWRDGYAPLLAKVLEIDSAEATRRFDVLIDSLRDPDRHASWMLHAVSGRAPA